MIKFQSQHLNPNTKNKNYGLTSKRVISTILQCVQEVDRHMSVKELNQAIHIVFLPAMKWRQKTKLLD